MEEFHLEVSIDPQNTCYVIEIIHISTKISWKVNRTLKDFHNLFNSLRDFYHGIPYPPGYSNFSFILQLFSKTSPQIQTFLNSILSLKNIYKNESFLKFIEIDRNFPENPRLKITENDYKVTVYPVKFIEIAENVYFTAEIHSESILKMNVYLNYLGISDTPLSQICCFGSFGTWRIPILEVITSFNYSPKLTILSAGLDTGSIMFIRVKTENDYSEYEHFGKIQVHEGPVCGLSIDYKTSKVYSCSYTGDIVINSLADKEFLVVIKLNCAPNGMIMTEDMKKLFLPCDRDIYFYDLAEMKEKWATEIQFLGFISCLCVSSNEFLIVGGFSGDVEVVNSDFVLIQRFCVFGSVNQIVYDEGMKIVFIGDSKGNLYAWDNGGEVILMWKGHKNVLGLSGAEGKLISSGSDNRIVFWSFCN